MPVVVDLHVRNGVLHIPTLDLMHHVSLHLDDESFAAHYARPEVRLMPPEQWQGMDDPDNNFVRQRFGGKEAYVEEYLAFESRLVKALFDAGVPILAGTDVTAAPGMIYGDSLHVELELLVGAGLTPHWAFATRKVESPVYSSSKGLRQVVIEIKANTCSKRGECSQWMPHPNFPDPHITNSGCAAGSARKVHRGSKGCISPSMRLPFRPKLSSKALWLTRRLCTD
jgi:hypothetical protein